MRVTGTYTLRMGGAFTHRSGHPANAWLVVLALSLAGCAEFTALKPSPASSAAAPGAASGGESAALEAVYQQGLARAREGRESEAARLFRTAAERGHPGAAYELGIAYTKGRGVESDLEVGASWVNRAAEAGEPRAQYLVGATYFAGTGVEQDYQRAIPFLRAAALQGHPRAQFLMGEAYTGGLGVSEDPAWGARWYGKAAHQGHREAQFAYGVMHHTGLGLPVDAESAYVWLTLAEALGHPAAPKMRALGAAGLSAAERERGHARAKRFEPEPSARFDDAPTVKYVQHQLERLGLRPGPVDGLVGPLTRAAVRAYQQRSGLAPDGVISPALVDRLRLEANL